jgi:mono/diheme cytochrome c family protein
MRRIRALVALAAIIWVCGCKADPPGTLERHVITLAKHHVFVGNRDQKNPLPATPATIGEGKEAFTHYCVACHGMDGQNTGVPFANHMSPPIPLLNSGEVQQYTDGQLKWVIDNGFWPSGMPAAKGTLNDEDVWSIVVFLRNLPPAGSLGTPEMYTH